MTAGAAKYFSMELLLRGRGIAQGRRDGESAAGARQSDPFNPDGFLKQIMLAIPFGWDYSPTCK